MTSAVPHVSPRPARPHDLRLTDEVVKAAVAAGLKAPPHIEDFARAMLGAALPLLESATEPVRSEPDETVVFINRLDEMTRDWLERNHPDFARGTAKEIGPAPRRGSLETGHRIVTEIVVHGFDNDEEAERAIRPFEPMIARALDAEAVPLSSRDVVVFWSARTMRGETVFSDVGPVTPELLDTMRDRIVAANHGERVVLTGWQRFEA